MMGELQIINTTMLSLCIFICLVLSLCAMTSDYKDEKLTRVLMQVLGCHSALMIADAVIFSSTSGAVPLNILKTAYFLSYFLGTVLLLLFSRYFIAMVELNVQVRKSARNMAYTAMSLCGLNFILIIITQWTGIIYSVDDSGIYRLGNIHILTQINTFACMALNMGIILMHRKAFRTREFIFFTSYVVLPATATIIHNVSEGTIAAIDVSTTIVLLIFFIGIQNEVLARLKQKESEARVSVMLSQIQPHFLYNALTTISYLCDENKEAQEALLTFAEYLRSNMNSLTQKQLIPFETELRHTKQYLFLEQLRFEERLQVEYDVNVTDFKLPVLTLQPIAENAVRHGLIRRESGGKVTIKTEETGGSYRITVIDNGVGFNPDVPPDSKRLHVGVSNVRSRLAVMCGGSLTIQSSPGAGTTVVIEIPKD